MYKRRSRSSSSSSINIRCGTHAHILTQKGNHEVIGVVNRQRQQQWRQMRRYFGFCFLNSVVMVVCNLYVCSSTRFSSRWFFYDFILLIHTTIKPLSSLLVSNLRTFSLENWIIIIIISDWVRLSESGWTTHKDISMLTHTYKRYYFILPFFGSNLFLFAKIDNSKKNSAINLQTN